MPYSLRTYDEILNDILTDIRNLFPGADTSVGSLVYMKASGYASQIWGLEKFLSWIAKQIFPDTADTENLEHHAHTWDIARTYGETDAALLTRLLDRIRRPPAGGNRHDYVKWAKEIDNVAEAYCTPLAQGLNTVDVVILANVETTGSEIPGQDLLDEVTAHIDDLRPVTSTGVYVTAPEVVEQDVTITVSGGDTDAIREEIEAYLSNLAPGETLYRSQLTYAAVAAGAANAAVSVPATDVTVTNRQIIRPGTVDVTAA